MARSRKAKQVARAQARLPGGSIADNLDPEFDDDLESDDGLTGFLEAGDELAAQTIDQLIVKALPNRDHVLRLKQTLPQGTLDGIRDLLLEGADVDALAILATELGMAPKENLVDRRDVTDQIHLRNDHNDIVVEVRNLETGKYFELIRTHGALDSRSEVIVSHTANVRFGPTFIADHGFTIDEDGRRHRNG
jgi:hypothetical protein